LKTTFGGRARTRSKDRIRPVMKASVFTVGCRLNQSESDALRARLVEDGVMIVKDPADAGECFINTCTVTNRADRSSVQLIRRICRLRPKPRVVVIGCFVQRLSEKVKAIPGVDEVWDNKRKLAEISDACPAPERSRALLKVQDGCDRGCAYCICSLLRGKPTSLPRVDVVSRFDRLVKAGFHEIVLTGLNLGTYYDNGVDLAGLLGLLSCRPGDFRIRLGSIEPDTVNSTLVDCFADKRISPHFHLPLQSGDDRILERMGRRYTSCQYAELVRQIRGVRPDANIGADVIVGLPGEDEDSFERTRSFVASLKLGYLHVFPFCPRPGTKAYSMKNCVPEYEKKRRSKTLRNLSTWLRSKYQAQYIGKLRQAVVESGQTALTDNYLRLHLEGNCPVEPRGFVNLLIGQNQGRPVGFLEHLVTKTPTGV